MFSGMGWGWETWGWGGNGDVLGGDRVGTLVKYMGMGRGRERFYRDSVG